MTLKEWKRLNAISKRIFKHLNCFYCEEDPKFQAALLDLYAFVIREERSLLDRRNKSEPSKTERGGQ